MQGVEPIELVSVESSLRSIEALEIAMRGRLKVTVLHIFKFFELRHRSNHILESCRSGVMVSISAFQALDPGSIPGCDILFCALRCEMRLFPANSDDFSSRNVESNFFYFFFGPP